MKTPSAYVTRKKEKPDKKFDLIYLSDDDEISSWS